MGVGILYRNAVASRVANGTLKLIDVPELKEMGVQSFIIYDKRKPIAPIAAEFLEMLRKRDSVFRTDNKKIGSGAALSLREKKAHSTKMIL
jgi:hypothetical protein